MMDFVIIVLAILVAQVITAVVAVQFLCSDRVIRWYAKKTVQMTNIIEKEVEKSYQEDRA